MSKEQKSQPQFFRNQYRLFVWRTSWLHLYSVNEDAAGRVSAYAINPVNGNLTFLNTASANGQFTTQIKVHPSGQYFYAANYGTGKLPVYRINANGSIGPMTDEFQSVGNGTGPNPARQEG